MNEQARKDAEADAETLLGSVHGYYDAAYEAARAGDWVRRALNGQTAIEPHVYARAAARHAFRAVPALRGE